MMFVIEAAPFMSVKLKNDDLATFLHDRGGGESDHLALIVTDYCIPLSPCDYKCDIISIVQLTLKLPCLLFTV